MNINIIGMKKEIVRYTNLIEAIKDACGELKILSSREDFEPASLAMATISGPTIPHYHTFLTEFYFVWEGTGKIIVGRDRYDIKVGTMVIIPPDRVHYTIPGEIMKVLVFSVPAWFEEDQIIVEEGMACYSSLKERLELIEELLIRSERGFTEEMSSQEKETLDTERQSLIIKMGWDKLSIPELRELLTLEIS